MLKIFSRKLIQSIVFFYIMNGPSIPFSYALSDADKKASCLRNGWIGAEYVAMGKAAEAIVDDAFSIYWNPAGLRELENTIGYADSGATGKDRDRIDEDDLLTFSEDNSEDIHISISAGLIDIKSQAGFIGAAFKGLNGIIGIGAYSVFLREIEFLNKSEINTNSTQCLAGTGIISYGISHGVASFGISIKGLYENFEEKTYYGIGSDIGTQIEIIPLIKIGLVVQDAGTILRPLEIDTGDEDHEFVTPFIKFSAALDNISGFTFSFTGGTIVNVDYEFNYGIRYSISNQFTVSAGLNDYSLLTAGFSCSIIDADIAYSFSYDFDKKKNNNIVSFT